jgi:hypothetical protein
MKRMARQELSRNAGIYHAEINFNGSDDDKPSDFLGLVRDNC